MNGGHEFFSSLFGEFLVGRDCSDLLQDPNADPTDRCGVCVCVCVCVCVWGGGGGGGIIHKLLHLCILRHTNFLQGDMQFSSPFSEAAKTA